MDKIPEIHMGKHAWHAEKKEVETIRGNRNRWAKEQNEHSTTQELSRGEQPERETEQDKQGWFSRVRGFFQREETVTLTQQNDMEKTREREEGFFSRVGWGKKLKSMKESISPDKEHEQEKTPEPEQDRASIFERLRAGRYTDREQRQLSPEEVEHRRELFRRLSGRSHTRNEQERSKERDREIER